MHAFAQLLRSIRTGCKVAGHFAEWLILNFVAALHPFPKFGSRKVTLTPQRYPGFEQLLVAACRRA